MKPATIKKTAFSAIPVIFLALVVYGINYQDNSSAVITGMATRDSASQQALDTYGGVVCRESKCIDDYHLKEKDDCWNRDALCREGTCVNFNEIGWPQDILENVKNMKSQDSETLAEAVIALSQTQSEQVVPILIKALEIQSYAYVREYSAQGLGNIRIINPKLLQNAITALDLTANNDLNANVRAVASQSLAKLQHLSAELKNYPPKDLIAEAHNKELEYFLNGGDMAEAMIFLNTRTKSAGSNIGMYEYIRFLDEEVPLLKNKLKEESKDKLSYWILKESENNDILEPTFESGDIFLGQIENYIAIQKQKGELPFQESDLKKAAQDYVRSKRYANSPISMTDFFISNRNYYILDFDKSLEYIDNLVVSLEKNPSSFEYIRIIQVSNFINIYADDPRTKEYILNNRILQRIWNVYLDSLDESEKNIYGGKIIFLLDPISSIISVYGNDILLTPQSFEIINHIKAVEDKLAKDRVKVNLIDRHKFKLENAQVRKELEIQIQRGGDFAPYLSFYYNQGEEMQMNILFAFASIKKSRKEMLDIYDKQKIVEAVMKRVSIKGDANDDYTSVRKYTKSFINGLSWVYGADLIPVLKDSNLKLDISSADKEELIRLGWTEDKWDTKTQYNNALWFIVENFHDRQGSFNNANSLKGDFGSDLFWTLLNIMRTADYGQKQELFNLMKETHFEDKFLKISPDDPIRIVFEPYFDEYEEWNRDN